MVTKEQYLYWQNLLSTNLFFRYFWQFWSNYSFIILGLVFVEILVNYNLQKFEFAVVCSLASFIIARIVLVSLINLFYHRTRPYQKYNFQPITSKLFSFQTKIHNSFPSRHAAALSSVAIVLMILFPYVGLGFLLPMLVLTGFGRVILGYHYPTDILAGVFIGLLSAVLSIYVLNIFW